MAVINIERLEQFKKECEIQKGIHKTAFAAWVDGVNNRAKGLSPVLMDILDTYSYFVKNKMNPAIFGVKDNQFHIDRTSMSFNKAVSKHVCAYCNASDGKIWINSYFGGCIDYKSMLSEFHAKQIYNNIEMRSIVEFFVLDLEQYCAIVTNRLNNI